MKWKCLAIRKMKKIRRIVIKRKNLSLEIQINFLYVFKSFARTRRNLYIEKKFSRLDYNRYFVCFNLNVKILRSFNVIKSARRHIKMLRQIDISNEMFYVIDIN